MHTFCLCGLLLNSEDSVPRHGRLHSRNIYKISKSERLFRMCRVIINKEWVFRGAGKRERKIDGRGAGGGSVWWIGPTAPEARQGRESESRHPVVASAEACQLPSTQSSESMISCRPAGVLSLESLALCRR